LPASQEPAAAERFQCALGCVVMGVALNRLREPLHDAGVVPLELQPLLGEALREVAAYIAGGADAPRQDLALAALRRFGRGLEALLAQPSKDLGATRQRFIMNVA
ncbi:FUSC family protein, partial [Pseudomonas aeruginosa]